MKKLLSFIVTTLVTISAIGQSYTDMESGIIANTYKLARDTQSFFSNDSSYHIESPMYSLGSKRYSTRNTLMQIAKDQTGYYFIVILPVKDENEEERFYGPSPLRQITLYDSNGDSVTLSHCFVSRYFMSAEMPGLIVGTSDYRLTMAFTVDDIESLLSREYVGYDIARGYCREYFSGKAKRIRSFNKNLRTAKRVLDKRSKSVFKRRNGAFNPDM